MKFEKIRYIERKNGEILEELVPGEGYLKFLYYNPLGALPLNMLVKRKFLTSWYGKNLDKPSSTKKIAKFIQDTKLNTDEIKKDISEFKNFNEFFYRELKDDARPIDMDKNHLVSPADGKILAFNDFEHDKRKYIKGIDFTLDELFQNKKLAQKFYGGTFVIIRLAPVDYHRFHFPADGFISKSHKVDGDYYSVSTHAIRKNFMIFCENKREYSILETKNFGDIALFEVGATMVGGIKQKYTQNTHVSKGDLKGWFYFGGSTVLMIFEKGKIKIDEDIIKNTQNGIETKVYMGEKIGQKA